MANLTLKKITEQIMELAHRKKFGVKPNDINTLEKIALIHSEISEAMEAFRHKKMKGQHSFSEELTDAVIRIFHLAGIYKIDLQKEIIKKLNINKKRKWNWNKLNETHS